MEFKKLYNYAWSKFLQLVFFDYFSLYYGFLDQLSTNRLVSKLWLTLIQSTMLFDWAHLLFLFAYQTKLSPSANIRQFNMMYIEGFKQSGNFWLSTFTFLAFLYSRLLFSQKGSFSSCTLKAILLEENSQFFIWPRFKQADNCYLTNLINSASCRYSGNKTATIAQTIRLCSNFIRGGFAVLLAAFCKFFELNNKLN